MPKTTYKSRHDTDVIPAPMALPMPHANAVAVDTPFKNRILRVTDPSISARHCWTVSSSSAAAWNTDSTYFLYTPQGSYNLHRFDAATFTSTFDHKLPLANCQFSFESPLLMYGTLRHKIFEYNVQTRQMRELCDLISVTGEPIKHEGRVTESQGWVCVACGTGAQDADIYVVLYRLSNGQKIVLNTMTSTIDGEPLVDRLGFPLHAAELTKGDPRYCILTPTAGTDQWQTYVWDLKAEDFIYPITVRDMGHTADAFGRRMNPSYQAGVKSAFLRGLAYDQVDHPAYHVPFANGVIESHYGWANAVGWAPVPIIGSTAQVTEGPWEYLSGEIFGMSTDPAVKTVWRFCHNRSLWDGQLSGANFYDTPRGNVSMDGKYFLFSSNWLRTLGGAAGHDAKAGAFRSDVFLVELT